MYIDSYVTQNWKRGVQMKIGLVAVKCINEDTTNNLNQILKYMDIVQDEKIDYIFFGESFI